MLTKNGTNCYGYETFLIRQSFRWQQQCSWSCRLLALCVGYEYRCACFCQRGKIFSYPEQLLYASSCILPVRLWEMMISKGSKQVSGCEPSEQIAPHNASGTYILWYPAIILLLADATGVLCWEMVTPILLCEQCNWRALPGANDPLASLALSDKRNVSSSD